MKIDNAVEYMCYRKSARETNCDSMKRVRTYLSLGGRGRRARFFPRSREYDDYVVLALPVKVL